MTLLVTTARQDFVLSVADRRTTIQRGNRLEVVDEQFNKHVLFRLRDATGVLTFTGTAQWTARSGKLVTTDEVVAHALAESARAEHGLGEAAWGITDALARERVFLGQTLRGYTPTFTIALAGYLDAIREPWIGLITDADFVPDWDQDACQIKGVGVAPFHVHFAIRERCVFINGREGALPAGSLPAFERILEADGSTAYELAKLIVKRVREAARKDSGVGSRVSAIVMPASGFVDTCLWQGVAEPISTAMPRMVFQDGRQWEPSEPELDFQDIAAGRLQRHGLLFHHLTALHYQRRVGRLLRRLPGSSRLPTIYELIVSNLYPEH